MGPNFTTLLLAATVSMLGGLIFGYELGIISGALLQLKTEYYLSCFEQEALVSALLVGALFASLIGGIIIDRTGRRTSILGSNLVVLAGSFILILGSSFQWLIIGRVTVGFAISISSMACCIYISEIVHPHQRGMLVSLYETGITVGILVSYAMNYFLASQSQGWKLMFGLAIGPAIMQFVVILFLPSNQPKQNIEDPQDTENGLIPLHDLNEQDVNTDTNKRQYSFLDLFRIKDNMRSRTIVGLGLVLFQQLTGQPNVLYYASTIFRSAGFQSNSSAVLASVGLGVVKVLSTLVAMNYADKAGRRVLLIIGCIVMAVSITGIGLVSFSLKLDTRKDCEFVTQLNTSFHLPNSSVMIDSFRGVTEHVALNDSQGQESVSRIQTLTLPEISKKLIVSSFHTLNESSEGNIKHTASPANSNNHMVLNWITLLSMMAFVSAFSIGFGPMTWLVLSEIYPAEIRGRAFAFCNSFNWAANLLITLSFLDVIDSIGLSWTFLLYGLMGAAAVAFIYFFIPETKGQSLEEIDKQFSATRLLKGRELWKRLGRSNLPGLKYQRMDTSSSSLSSTSSTS